MRNRLTSCVLLKPACCGALAILSMAATGCWQTKQTRTFTPPPPKPPQVLAQTEHLPDPPVAGSTPDLSEGSLVPNGVQEVSGPPAPRTPARNRPAATTPVKPPPTVATEQTPPPAPTPRLGQLLTPDKAREYTRELDESLDRVKRVVARLEKKNLTQEQAEVFGRIQVFQKQAETAREQDLVLAVNIARRADLLAKDLGERVQ